LLKLASNSTDIVAHKYPK